MSRKPPAAGRFLSGLPPDVVRMAVQYSPSPVLIITPSGTIEYANAAAMAALNFRHEDLLGTPLLDLLEPQSRREAAQLLAEATRGPTGIVELRQRTAAGQILQLGYQGLPVRGSGAAEQDCPVLLLGNAPAVVTTAQRMHELNRQLNALFTVAATAASSLSTAELLRQALSIVVSELNLIGAAIFLTGARLRSSGPASQSDGADADGSSSPTLRLVAQQGFQPGLADRFPNVENLLALGEDALRRHEPVIVAGSLEQLGLEPADLEGPPPASSVLALVTLRSEEHVLGWLLALAEDPAFQQGEHELLSIVGNLLGAPIENARLYEALVERTGQLQAVLDSINAGVLLVDGGGVVRYANPRLGALLQVDVATWPGQRRARLVLPELTPVAQDGQAGDGQLLELHAPERRFLRRFTDPVYDAQGVHIGEIEVYSDVTQLHQMNQLKDEFVAAAAHDLKTPVTAVKGFAQIALRMARQGGDEQLLRQLEMINARSDDLAYLMDSLLDISRIQAGRMRLELSTFSLAKLLDKVVQHFAFDLRRHPRPLTVVPPATPLDVTWDRPRAERLLINLIGNALKYSPAGSPIEIRVLEPETQPRAAGLDVLLAVSDQGRGIAEQERELVFERFYRSPEAIAHGYKGTGLGLYIARYVVELHGGRIWLDDAIGEGPGTTFFVALPQEVRGG